MDLVVENGTKIVQEIAEGVPMYTWHDYTLFVIMLATSALVGVYFACSGNKQSTADEYLLGGKEMGVFPISMSLIASFVSGITILAVPADVYLYGSTYWLCGVSIGLALFTSYFLFIPVFYKLQLSSTYEYLNLRFNDNVRKFSSLLFAFAMFMYLPIVIYVPALALAQGTGFNIHFITPVVCGVCVFYTTIGGLKAVVWTDTLQFIVMIFASTAITYLGTMSAGGFLNIMDVSNNGGRLNIDLDFDPTKRDTLMSVLFGTYFLWLSGVGVGQGCIQKCLALPTFKHVKKTFIIFAIGMFIITAGSVYSGLMLYGKYSQCDPQKAKRITAADQMLPLFVLEAAGQVPGLPGLFVAGVFSAALSSLSAVMNSMSCTVYQDFISAYMPTDISQKKVSNILKVLVALIGIVSTSLVFVVEKLGNILQLGLSLGGMTAGPLLGLFSLGMLVPSATSKAAMSGAIGSLLCMTWVVVGSQYYKVNGYFKYEKKPVSVEDCMTFINYTEHSFDAEDFDPSFVYKISHYYYVFMGATIVFLIALPVIWFSKSEEKPVNKDLISPVMQWAIKDQKTYFTVERAMHMLKTNG